MKIHTVELSCGCLICLLGTGALEPYFRCNGTGCSFYEEFLCSPLWVKWKVRAYLSSVSESFSEEEIKLVKSETQRVYDERMKRHGAV